MIAHFWKFILLHRYVLSTCSNSKPVLQSNTQLQALEATDAIHGFVCISMAIKITRIELYDHNLWFLKCIHKAENNTTKNETAILIMYKYILNYNRPTLEIPCQKWRNNRCLQQLTNSLYHMNTLKYRSASLLT